MTAGPQDWPCKDACVLRTWTRVPVDSFFLVKTFVTLIVVIDPVAAVPLFLTLTDRSSRASARAAWQAVVVAALIMGVFALFGQQILLYLGIRLPSLEAAGGCCWWLPLTCCGVRSRGCQGGEGQRRLRAAGDAAAGGPGAIAATGRLLAYRY